MNELLNNASLQTLGLQAGEKVLDMGSGIGQLTHLMGAAVGSQGHVVGIERSMEQLTEAERLLLADGAKNRVEFRQGDASSPPLRSDEWSSFDVVHTRFLLEHIPSPLEIVRTMVRAARIGGRIILQDDAHDTLRLWPEPEWFSPIWKAYVDAYRLLGNDPLIGHKLVSLLYEAGAEPKHNGWTFFGGCQGDPSFHNLVENLIGVIEGARETMVAGKLLSSGILDQGLAALDRWRSTPDAAIWYALSWAMGVRNN
jgi:ubiquinone/menaquinone biosynthesis C-methylase UbiE